MTSLNEQDPVAPGTSGSVAPPASQRGLVEPSARRGFRGVILLLGRVLLRAAALVVGVAGVAKLTELWGLGGDALQYSAPLTVSLGLAELALAAAVLFRPSSRAVQAMLLGFLVLVTGYVLFVPPGEWEAGGCGCFGDHFRFQDVASHLRFNGALIDHTGPGPIRRSERSTFSQARALRLRNTEAGCARRSLGEEDG